MNRYKDIFSTGKQFNAFVQEGLLSGGFASASGYQASARCRAVREVYTLKATPVQNCKQRIRELIAD